MYRILRFMILIFGGLAVGLIGIALVVGQQLPAGDQAAMAMPYRPRWSQIALVSMDRRLAASYYLPMRVQQITWTANGTRLVASGKRTTRKLVYGLNYPNDGGIHPFVRSDAGTNTSAAQGFFSPDLQWMILPGGEDFVIYKLDGTRIQPGDSNVRIDLIIYSQWSPDSRYFLYALADPQNRSGLSHYYVVDVRTGEKHLISDQPVYNVTFTPDNTFLFYSISSDGAPEAGTIPGIENYYLYDLVTGEIRQVIEGPLSQWIWSADGTRLAYLRPLITDTPPLADQSASLPPTGALPSVITGENSLLQGEPGTIPDPGKSILQFQPGVLDLTTGDNQLIGEPQEGYTSIDWMPDDQGVFITVARSSASNGLYSLPMMYSNAETDLYYARLNETTPDNGAADGVLQPHLLEFEGEKLTVVRRLSHAGHRLLLTPAQMTSAAPQQFYIMDTWAGTITPLPLPDGEEFRAAGWSPDGESLVMTTLYYPTSQTYSLTPLTPSLNNPTPVLLTPFPTLTSALSNFSAATNQAGTGFMVQVNALGSSRPVFHNYLLRSTDSALVLLASGADYDRIYWSPDSQRLMYYQTGNDGRLVLKLIDVSQSQPEVSPAYQFPVQSVRLWSAYQSDNLLKWRPEPEG